MLLSPITADLSRWPENSLEGYVAAAATSIDGLEIDVSRSADGTWWLMHDPTVDRTTDGTGPVSKLSDAELRALTIDGGNGFREGTHHGLRVPTLDDVLDALPHDKQVMIDVKPVDVGAYEELARILKEHELVDSYVICETLEAASAIKAADPRFQTLVSRVITWHAAVDIYLANAEGGMDWPEVPVSDWFGEAAMYVPAEFTGDESAYLDQARRWGVFLSVVNNSQAAVDWRDRTGPAVIEVVWPRRDHRRRPAPEYFCPVARAALRAHG